MTKDFKLHTVALGADPVPLLREAAIAGIRTMVQNLRDNDILDAVFVLAVCRQGSDMPDVQMASNLPPEHASEFLRLLSMRTDDINPGAVQ